MPKSLVKRNAKGQILPGSAGISPGRPPRARELAYLNVMIRTCTLDHWAKITEKAVEQAENGNKDARKWLSDYIIGPAALLVQATIASTVDANTLDANVSRMLSIISAARGTIEGESVVIEDEPSGT